MKTTKTDNRIRELLARFRAEFETAAALKQQDIFVAAEDLLVPLFKVVFGYKNLNNLNLIKANFPAVDLAADDAGVAIQVTATSSNTKVLHTLRQFVKYDLFEKYSELKIYILTEKQASYSDTMYGEIIGGRFDFKTDRDIWDYRTVAKGIGKLDFDQREQVKQLLESYFDDESPTVAHSTRNVTYISGDAVEGDHITVGNITGSSSIAIGRGAKAEVRIGKELRDDYEIASNWEAKGKPRMREFDLSGRNLSGLNLAGADLTGSNLRGAKLAESNLSRAKLSDANLEDANLWNAKLIKAQLHGIILDHANLADANLIEAEIIGRSLHGAILKRAILRKAKVIAGVINADLSDAELQGADLSGVPDLWRVMSLTGAKYDKDTKWPSGFDPKEAGAILVDAGGNPIENSK